MSVTMVGVDPGGRYTGVVTRSGDGVSACRVITRAGDDDFPTSDYIHEIIDEIAKQMTFADAIAAEGVVEPNPHVRVTNVAGIIGTGMVLGAVIARWPQVIVVAPEGNGALPDFAYPHQIRARARLGGPSNHARSAYDVAKAAAVIYRADQQHRGGSR